MNDLSLWQVGNHVIDVLSAGPEGQIINLPAAAVDLAKQYKHVIVWADERDIADKAAKQIGAAAMESPKSAEYPKGADANDMLKAGALFDWLTFAMGQLGVEVPPLPPVAPTPSHAPAYSNTLMIKDAQPFDFSFEADPAAPMATQAAYDAHRDDLTSFVGLDVTDGVMDVLTGRAKAYGWNYGTSRTADGWHIHRLIAFKC